MMNKDTMRPAVQRAPSASPEAAGPALQQPQAQHLFQRATNSLVGHIAALCEGVVIVDKQARITWLNEQYTQRLGVVDPAALMGQPVERLLSSSLMRTVVDTGRPFTFDIIELGTESVVFARLPLRDDKGQVTGAVGIALQDNAMGMAPVIRCYDRLRQDYADVQRKLADTRRAKHTLSSLVGNAPACVELKRQARRAARSDAAVLIQGEQGTGKELLAQAIHNASDRAAQAFVAVHLAAIPPNLLEAEFFGHGADPFWGAASKDFAGTLKQANGGTLFLDEVGEMPAAFQATLLRVLLAGEYETPGTHRLQSIDVRIVAATRWDLQAEVAAGRFNPALYQHLNAMGLHMPPLRERLADLGTLCEHLLDALAQKLRLPPLEIAPEALDRLAHCDWPGNVRELSNVLERVLLVGNADTITAEDVDAVLPARQTSLGSTR